MRIGDELVRPIIRALDDVPVHGRQLGEMVRGLRGKQRRNRSDVENLDAISTPSVNPPIDRDRNPKWLNDYLDRDDIEPWRRRRAEGQQFNYQNHHRYPQNEVTLGNGKRLDSYVPDAEIVSRKFTQLDAVRPETAKSYIDEILTKYRPGMPIKGGGRLDGVLILEVPVQDGGSVSQEIIDHANGKEPPVKIRDVLGNVYN